MGMRKIYWQIARENGVIVKEARDGMQEAVNAAYQNPPKDRGGEDSVQGRNPHTGRGNTFCGW